MYKIAVVDDESEVRQGLVSLLREYFATHKIMYDISEYTDGKSILHVNVKYDIAFLDIELGEVTGIEVGKKLKKINPNIIIIIITSYDRYLDDAFDLHSFRYFQKPIDQQRLCKALDVVIRQDGQIAIKEANEMIKISYNDITYICIEGRKTVIHTGDGKTFETREKLEQWKEKLFHKYFAQPHSSYIINLKYVTKYSRDSVELRNNHEEIMSIYISRRKYHEFNESFMNFLEER